MPPSLIPELQAAAERAGLDWSKFEITDNSCPAKPVPQGPLEELESDIETVERFATKEFTEIEQGIEPKLKSFGKGFTILEKEVEHEASKVVDELREEEEAVSEELRREAQAAAKLIKRMQMEASMGGFGRFIQQLPMSLREIIMPM